MDKLKVALQYILPKHLLSRLTGKLAAAELGSVTTGIIKWFIKRYKIDMSEAAQSDPEDYSSFNAFFTRALKPDSRPLCQDNDALVYPVDGAISQYGTIRDGQIVQAKGHQYSALELLGNQTDDARMFEEGNFATIYLAPKDYHRIHMPISGTLTKMTYVPGDLFSVNPLTAANVSGLFARNERVIALFETKIGPLAMVLVGATIVASIETVWAGTVAPSRTKNITTWNYPTRGFQARTLAKGAEMGRFKLGSTVVMLWGNAAISNFVDGVAPNVVTRMGQAFVKVSSTGQQPLL